MLQCIAVDDEKPALDLLVDNISKVPFLHLAAKCRNAMEAIKVIQQQKVDLMFLDIQMPGLTGLQFLQSMVNKPMVIFITAYEKYALEGYNLDALDYLLKPVELERFFKACNKALELHTLRTQVKTEIVLQPAVADHFFVHVNYSMLKIELHDIVFIEGLKDYIKIHLHSVTRPVVTRMPMKIVEDKLPAQKFIRIHKSYIVSVRYISAIRKKSIFINDTELPVSENYKEAIVALLGTQ